MSQLPTTTADHEVQADGEPLVAPPAESIWTRYSPHHEFPLSSVASVTMHVLVLALLVFAGVIAAALGLNRDSNPPVDTVVVLPGGGGGHPDGVGDARGDRPPAPPVEDVPTEPKDQPNIPTAVRPLESVKVDPVKLPEFTKSPEGLRFLEDGTDALARFEKVSQNAREKLLKGLEYASKGGGGPGRDGGKDKGKGPGEGSNVGPGKGDGNLTVRQKRVLRWTMMFNTLNGNDYAKQLDALGAILAVPDEQGQYRVIRNLKQRPALGNVEDLAAIQRIFWNDTDPRSITSLSMALGLRPVPPHIVAFFPEKLEQELLRKELEFGRRRKANITEDDIHETRFKVVQRGGTYEALVESQRY
jgi:hypothetical protein